ncbi:hypothetical protein L7F22_036337 [Adiantum nelumboides]|nr:hypothetical protein [Adiantum nelumboides]
MLIYIEKEDAYLNMSQKHEEKGNVGETANVSLSDSIPQEYVDIVDESQELVVVVDKSQEKPDVIIGETMPELDFLTSHMAEQSEDVEGMRDKRVRLSVSFELQFYDIQDRLGFQQPSHVFEWLMQKDKYAIDELPSSSIQNSSNAKMHGDAQAAM